MTQVLFLPYGDVCVLMMLIGISIARHEQLVKMDT